MLWWTLAWITILLQSKICISCHIGFCNWGGLTFRYNISSSLMFLHQWNTWQATNPKLINKPHNFLSLLTLSVFNKNFLGLLQSPVMKKDLSKSYFDCFHYHKMISHSRPISRKVWWEQHLMENRTMNWVFDLGFINCDLNVKRKVN